LGRISVTVGFGFTGWMKQPPCQREVCWKINEL
jgi:hypothetical protein